MKQQAHLVCIGFLKLSQSFTFPGLYKKGLLWNSFSFQLLKPKDNAQACKSCPMLFSETGIY